jgi:hypothetical protein
MKQIILSVMLVAFALAVQAADDKPCQAKDKDMPACCGNKVKTSVQSKATCPFMKTACCKAATQAKQPVLLSPKAADAIR